MTGTKKLARDGRQGRAVPREAPTRDDGVDVGVVLELPAPGMEDAGKPWEIGPDETLVLGQPFEGHGRRVKHRLVCGALMRADEGAKRLRDREGEEEVRPWELFVEVVLAPLLGFMLRALGTVAVATGMVHAVLSPTG